MSSVRRFRAAIGDRVFLRRLLALALPIAFQNFLGTSLNMVDTLMIGQLGESSIAAVALGNQIYFLLILTLFGVGSGASIFAAQYWGNKDTRGVQQTYGLALCVALVAAAVFSGVTIFAGSWAIGLYSRDPVVVAAAARYVGIVGFSYPATAISFISYSILRSIGRVRLPLFGTVSSLIVNVIGNYALIFGNFGFPALGITGAAIATLIARLVEVVVVLTAVRAARTPLAAAPRTLLAFDAAFVLRYAKRAAPVLLNEIGWSLGITMYSVVYARMGTNVLAAYNIADTVARLTFVFFVGSGNAAAVLIGNAIGAGRLGTAHRYTVRLLTILPVGGVFTGLVILSIAPFVPRAFAITPEVAGMVTAVLRVLAFVVVIKVLNMHIIVGILRSGGDTIFGAILEIGSLWIVGVSGAVVFGLVLGWPVHLVYLAAGFEELSKLILGLSRVRSGRWINRVAA